jgi:hypothetical protein
VKAAPQPLAAPKFRLLFLGRLVSFLGNEFAPIALAFAVLDLTGSAGDLGLVMAARSLPTIAFDAVTFVVAGALFAGLKLPSGSGVRAGVLRELAAGWHGTPPCSTTYPLRRCRGSTHTTRSAH